MDYLTRIFSFYINNTLLSDLPTSFFTWGSLIPVPSISLNALSALSLLLFFTLSYLSKRLTCHFFHNQHPSPKSQRLQLTLLLKSQHRWLIHWPALSFPLLQPLSVGNCFIFNCLLRFAHILLFETSLLNLILYILASSLFYYLCKSLRRSSLSKVKAPNVDINHCLSDRTPHCAMSHETKGVNCACKMCQ